MKCLNKVISSLPVQFDVRLHTGVLASAVHPCAYIGPVALDIKLGQFHRFFHRQRRRGAHSPPELNVSGSERVWKKIWVAELKEKWQFRVCYTLNWDSVSVMYAWLCMNGYACMVIHVAMYRWPWMLHPCSIKGATFYILKIFRTKSNDWFSRFRKLTWKSVALALFRGHTIIT